MIVPSAVNMKLRFPELADVDDATIEFAIESASRMVDDGWAEKHQTEAMMLYAAHQISVGILAADALGGGEIQSATIGRLSVTFRQPRTDTKNPGQDLTTTPYGRAFEELRNLNFPPIMVI